MMMERTSLSEETLQNQEVSFPSCLRTEVEKFLEQALETECSRVLKKWGSLKDRNGHQAIVRNGFYPNRTIRTGIGNVNVRIPRVRDRIHSGVEFHSALLHPYLRKCRSLDVLIPLLYLKRRMGRECQPILRAFLEKEIFENSSRQFSRMQEVLMTLHRHVRNAPILEDYPFLWIDGVPSKNPDNADKLFLLVILGETSRGERKILRFESAFRNSRETWDELLKDMKDKGLLSPLLVIGREDLGFWPSIRTIFPLTRRQFCWRQKEKIVLENLRQEDRGLVKNRLREIWQGQSRMEAEKRFRRFLGTYRGSCPEGMAGLEKDREALLEFFHFPAEHWPNIRDTGCVYLPDLEAVRSPMEHSCLF
ncbi:IS256 family transposase [Leptospirillum ferriphilum]|uniref:Mutator family transposase n=2 Tax=Leptospirillum ferriphilum TaxID=178606 RepID=A0A1V3STA0_9BACT|nr:transposase [Leptospirillum ferriphilum]OOH71197.1 hypothetical protein BOX24_09130 [Leptospirillum ferriphilum]OOH80903.1 hypothetical protein BOX30_05030 [Leptospirillum ferriphilum]